MFSYLYGERWGFDPAWIAVILCGVPIMKEAAEGLYRELDIRADVLVSLALIASISIGELFAAGEISVIMAIGKMLEDSTVDKMREGLESLVRMAPTSARLVKVGGDVEVSTDEVTVGDTLRVLPGETVPVDGIIIEGHTSIDQSAITGESVHADKKNGDEVLSGTINQFGAFTMKASRASKDSAFQRIVELMRSDDVQRSKIVRLADRWATYIVLLAALTSVLTWAVTGEVLRAVTILVVFCPCALVLATPTAMVAGIGNASKKGVMIKNGDALERLASVNVVVFDKTGTLTSGRSEVVGVVSTMDGLSDERLLELAASAEVFSEHPFGKAVVRHYRSGKGTEPEVPTQFQVLPGRGVTAKVGTSSILAGNGLLMKEGGVSIRPRSVELAKSYLQQGCTAVHVSIDGQDAGLVAISDTVRSSSKEVIDRLHKMGLRTIMITGDNEYVAGRAGSDLGIDEVYSNCLPEHKLTILREYERKGYRTCMVGDGVNDAPALKAAHVGAVMGGIGSDISIDAADISLVGDDLRAFPSLVLLANRTMRTIKINLVFSSALILWFTIMAMFGMLDPIIGALVHNVGSVVVIVNSVMLLRWKDRYIDAGDGIVNHDLAGNEDNISDGTNHPSCLPPSRY